MNTQRRVLSYAVATVLTALAASPALAQGGTRRITVPPNSPAGTTALTPVVSMNLTVPASFSAVIKTIDLSAGADTVLHVQDGSDAEGRFVAGNDDCAPPARYSCVTIPAKTTAQELNVLV